MWFDSRDRAADFFDDNARPARNKRIARGSASGVCCSARRRGAFEAGSANAPTFQFPTAMEVADMRRGGTCANGSGGGAVRDAARAAAMVLAVFLVGVVAACVVDLVGVVMR